jgi:hypothetical protein
MNSTWRHGKGTGHITCMESMMVRWNSESSGIRYRILNDLHQSDFQIFRLNQISSGFIRLDLGSDFDGLYQTLCKGSKVNHSPFRRWHIPVPHRESQLACPCPPLLGLPSCLCPLFPLALIRTAAISFLDKYFSPTRGVGARYIPPPFCCSASSAKATC